MAETYEDKEVILANPADSGLVLVHLDFHDGSKCKVWLQPDVIKRLQDGDDDLMEELRLQHASNATPSQTKRKLTDELAQDQDVKKSRSDEDGSIQMSVVTSRTFSGQQLVDAVSLNGVESSYNQVSYLEELTVGEDNYIELPAGSGYPLQQGLLIESIEPGTIPIKEEKLKPAYPPRKRRKKGLRRYMKYTVDQRDEAVKMIKSGLISQQEAARKYNIPQGTLSDHVRSGGSPYKCNICNRNFGLRSSLEHHQLSHFEARPFLCDFCGFNTKDHALLLKHRRTRHIESTDDNLIEEEILMEQEPDRCPKVTVWNIENTKVFMAQYEEVLRKFDDKCMKKKHIWHMLADKMCSLGHYVNARQCSTKWKTMISSYRQFKEHGEDRRSFSYFDNMEDFLHRTEGRRLDLDVLHEEKEKLNWNHDAVALLISEYEARKDQFEGTQVKRKVLWRDIHKVFQEAGYGFSEGQVQNKWKVIVRQFKNYQALRLPTDEAVRYFPWYEEMSHIIPQSSLEQEEQFAEIQIEEQLVDEGNFVHVVEQSEPIKSEIGFEETYIPTEIAISVVDHEGNDSQQVVHIEKIIIEENRDDNETVVEEGTEGQTSQSEEQSLQKEALPTIEAEGTFTFETIENFSFDSSMTTNGKRVDWTDEAVRLLLSEYLAMADKFKNVLVKKKILWNKMHERFLENGYDITAAQIENKWRVLTRNYTKAKSEGITCNDATYPYFEEVRDIFQSYPETIQIKLEGEDRQLYGSADDGSKVWSYDATMKMLVEYEQRLQKFEDSAVKKRVLWEEISEALSSQGIEMSAAQVENKWKVLLRCYKIAMGQCESTRKSREFPYLERMCEILGNKEETKDDLYLKDGDNSRDNQATWSHEATMLLLAEYGTRLDRFDSEYVKRKEYLWQEIYMIFKDQGYTYTVAQLMNKWKSLLKKYRTIVDSLYDPDTEINEKHQRKLSKFPYLIEMGQLLGHNHDVLSAHIEKKFLVPTSITPSDPQIGETICDSGKLLPKKSSIIKKKLEIKEPKTYKEVMKYFEQYEAEREELEKKRQKELSEMQENQLATVESIEMVAEYLKIYEAKRQIIEKKRMEEMAKMHKEKMLMLKNILKAVKKNKLAKMRENIKGVQ